MQIIPDPIFSLAMVTPFLASFVVLWKLLLVPYRQYLDEREEATVGARHEAARLTAQAEAKLADLEARLAVARQEAAALRAQHREAGLAYEQKVLEQARRAAEAELAEALRRIGEEREAARGALRSTAVEISKDIAGQVLGRPVHAGMA